MMQEISAGQVAAGDIGSRVVVIDDSGNAYTGILSRVTAMAWKWGERPEDKVRINLDVSSTNESELKLGALPLDFRLQIERPADVENTKEQ